MDNPHLKKRLNELKGKKFKYQDGQYNCLDWDDFKDVHMVQINTNNGVLPFQYRELHDFFNEIRVASEDGVFPEANNGLIKPPEEEEEPFLPTIIHQLFNRQDQEATEMSRILLRVAAEFGEGKPVTANTIERGKIIAQLAQAMTNQHKAQTSGIADVGKLFKLKPKPKKKDNDSPDQEAEE